MQATISTLSSKFKLPIPKSVRHEMHWAAGQELVFIPKGKAVLLMAAPTLQQLRGMAKGAHTDHIREREDQG